MGTCKRNDIKQYISCINKIIILSIETKSSTCQPPNPPASQPPASQPRQPASQQASSQPASQPTCAGTVFFTSENQDFHTKTCKTISSLSTATLPNLLFCNKSNEVLTFWPSQQSCLGGSPYQWNGAKTLWKHRKSKKLLGTKMKNQWKWKINENQWTSIQITENQWKINEHQWKISVYQWKSLKSKKFYENYPERRAHHKVRV